MSKSPPIDWSEKPSVTRRQAAVVESQNDEKLDEKSLKSVTASLGGDANVLESPAVESDQQPVIQRKQRYIQ